LKFISFVHCLEFS